MEKKIIKYGTFSTGLDYVSIGEQNEVVLFFLGGPGNDLPKGIELKFYTKPFAPIIKNYKVYFLTRKSGLTENYTTEKMAGDYAEIIQKDLGGHVHGVIGFSYGGMILQHFSALYPSLATKHIFLSASHKISEQGRKLDLKYAQLLSAGKIGSANALISEAIFPKGIKRTIFKLLVRLMGYFMGKHKNPTFAHDVMIEIEAELNHNATTDLSKIQIPVTLICGDNDYYFPIEYMEEMHELIPNSKLKIFPKKGHDLFEDPHANAYIFKELQA